MECNFNLGAVGENMIENSGIQITKKPRTFFIDLINKVINADVIDISVANTNGFISMKEFMNYFNSNCSYYDIDYKIVHLKNEDKYVLVTQGNFTEKLSKHLPLHTIPDRVASIMFENNGRPQDMLEDIIVHLGECPTETLEIPIPWGFILGYKSVDNLRDSIHRILKKHGASVHLSRQLTKLDKVMFFSFIFKNIFVKKEK